MRVTVRNWLIRGLILAGIAALAALGWIANSWVSPERVREQVLAHLHEQFEGVNVEVGSARMRILGGIAVTDLKISRPGDPPDRPFLRVPAAVLYHDKEQLNRGRLVIRKVELENPELHLERSENGRWNLDEVMKSSPVDRPIPIFVAKGAKLTITDHSPGGLPPLVLTDVRCTLLNDPLPVLTVQAHAMAQSLGPVEIRVRYNRVSRHASIGLECSAFPLGEIAPLAAQRFAPALVPHLGKITATALVQADLTYTPDADPAWRHDVRIETKDARWEHPDLPWPIEKIAIRLRSVDGRVKVEEATAKIGPSTAKLSLETRTNPPQARDDTTDDLLTHLEEQLQKIDLTLSGISFDESLVARLGSRGARIKRMFSPVGAIDFGYKFTREGAGWKREFEMRPQAVSMVYEDFRYPVSEVEGSIRRIVNHTGFDTTSIDLRGKAAGQPVTLKGTVTGDAPDPPLNLRIAGGNVPLDEKLIAAIPGKYPALIRQFRPSGRADFVAEIVRKPGAKFCENEFRVEIRDGSVNFTQFPFQLDKVKGQVVIRTTSEANGERDEILFDKFTGVHGGATIWMDGSKRPVPGSRDRLLVLHIHGTNCEIDHDLRKALSGLKLDGICTAFQPRGSLTFGADVEVMDRAPSPLRPEFDPPFDPASDLKLTFNFSGPTITPSFFPYELTDVRGWLEYRQGRVDLAHFTGKHGETRLKLAAGEIRFYPDGAIWVNLGNLEMKPFRADAALSRALPGKLRSAIEDLKLRGGADLTVKHLVVLTPPDPPASGVLPPPEPLGRPLDARLQQSTAGSNATAYNPPGFLARGQAPIVAIPTPQPLPTGPTTPAPPIRPDPVIYWDAELKLAGASLDTGVPWEDVFGNVACRGRYEGTHVGLVRGNVWLDRAVISKVPVTGMKARLWSDPQLPDATTPGQFLPSELRFADISGNLFHGMVGGEARVVLSEPSRYELWLTATDVQLEEVARHYKLGTDADLKGVAQAQLRIANRPDPRTGKLEIEGSGKIDVPTGRMYNLPVMLDLVKVLKLQTPDKTAFEEAHVVFRIAGDRIKVEQLDLIGKAVCLGGSGEVDMTGEYVRFEFYTIWSQVLKQMINTPLGDLGAFLSKNLFKIRMTRENGELRYRPEPVPVVTEPVKAVAERLRSRASWMMGK